MKKILILSAVLVLMLGAQTPNITKCYGCHGRNFEKHALGKSKIVKDMNSTAIYQHLINYKSGKAGRQGMGRIMNSEVRNYTNAELKLISKDISATKEPKKEGVQVKKKPVLVKKTLVSATEKTCSD